MRKGSTAALLIIFALLVGIGGVGFMMSIPNKAIDTAQRGVSEGETVTKARSIDTYVIEDYLNDAMKYNFYQTSYDVALEGGGQEVWTPGGIPAFEDVVSTFEQQVKTDFASKYIGGGGEKDIEGGSITLPDMDWEVSNAYSVHQEDKPDVTSRQTIPDRERGSVLYNVTADSPIITEIQSSYSTTRIRSPIEFSNISIGNRLFYLYDVAVALVNTEEFRLRVSGSVSNSSNWVIGTTGSEHIENCNGETTSSCGAMNSRSVTLPGQSSVFDSQEATQASRARGDLQDHLQEYMDHYFNRENIPDISSLPNPSERYRNISVEVASVSIEYEIESATKVSADNTKNDGWIVSDCQQSCYNRDSDTYNTCGGSCDADAEDCPATVCSTSSFSPSTSSTDFQRGETTWTDDPWWQGPSTGISFDPATSEDGDWQASMLPSVQDRHYGIGVSPPDDDDDDCETRTCHDTERANNNVYQQGRRIWRINTLHSTVQVDLEIIDGANRLPVRSGLQNTTFALTYEQEQTVQFNEDGSVSSVTYPTGTERNLPYVELASESGEDTGTETAGSCSDQGGSCTDNADRSLYEQAGGTIDDSLCGTDQFCYFPAD